MHLLQYAQKIRKDSSTFRNYQGSKINASKKYSNVVKILHYDKKGTLEVSKIS
jgi:dTDP-4-dehydrorhamnose 3,5-epimerase-like enzyme